MIKQMTKWVMSKTPFEIVRRHKPAHEFQAGKALKHNSMHEWDSKFDDPTVLDAYLSPARQRLNQGIIDTIQREHASDEPESIGDVGCGLGHFLELAGNAFGQCRLFGYDFSISGLREAQKRCPQAQFSQHDIYKPLPRQHNVILCSQTLEHLVEPDAAARNLIKGTCDGGIAIFTVPDGRLDTYNGHIHFWSPESWEPWVTAVSDGRRCNTFRMEGGTAGGANLFSVIYC